MQLTVISQERVLFTEDVDSLTATTADGEITVLPHHSPLFTRLTIGDFIYRIKGVEHHVVVTQGFMDISPENTATVIVDSATHERDLSLVKAQAAVAAAQETMQLSRDKRELLLAEASLKQALLAVKVAQRTKRGASL